MRVHVNAARCQGHTLCNLAAPELFKQREDDGHAYVEHELVPAAMEERARAAAATCPESAIDLAND